MGRSARRSRYYYPSRGIAESLDADQRSAAGLHQHHRHVRPFIDRLPAGVSVMRAVSVEEAVAMIPPGASIMAGGFMGVGTPERLLYGVVRPRNTDLSVICNDAAAPGTGVCSLLTA